MKRWVSFGIIFASLFSASVGYSFGEMKRLVKVGDIDLEKIKNEFPGMDEIKLKLYEETVRIEGMVAQKNQALAALEAEYQKKAVSGNSDELAKLETKIDIARKELAETVSWGTSYLESLKDRLITPVKMKINKYIKLVSIEQGYSFVFVKGSEFVAYFNTEYDVTGHILYKLKVDLKDEKAEIFRQIKKKKKLAEAGANP